MFRVRAITFVAVLSIAADAYARGLDFRPLRLTAQRAFEPASFHLWQVVAAVAMTTMLAAVAVASHKRLRMARRIALLEVSVFVVYNVLLFMRDGWYRLDSPAAGSHALPLISLVAGVVSHALILRAVLGSENGASSPLAGVGS